MDIGISEPIPEEVAQLEKRKERKERKDRKKLERREAQRNDPPPPQPSNSSFLARSWVKLPEVNETQIEYRVRVMTWNVCTIVSGHYRN